MSGLASRKPGRRSLNSLSVDLVDSKVGALLEHDPLDTVPPYLLQSQPRGAWSGVKSALGGVSVCSLMPKAERLSTEVRSFDGASAAGARCGRRPHEPQL